jgi:uncharacterized protein
MATVSIRLDDDLKERLDRVSESRGLNSSAVIRSAIEEKIAALGRSEPIHSPATLTVAERMMLSNQYRLMALLEPSAAKYHLKHARIVEEGYELDFQWMTQYLSDPFPRRKCHEVLRILDMYSSLIYSYLALTDKEDIGPHDVQFGGFDGNNETDYMAYATFVIFEQEKFAVLKEVDGLSMDSHFPTLRRHQSQLLRWVALGEPHSMNISQIRHVIDKPKGH